MAAEKKCPNPFLDEEGQSVMEFLFIVPMIVALIMLLIRTNSAIQISIVNQQYARAQALFTSFNSPIYPKLSLRVRELDNKKFNQIMMGVSKDAPNGDGGEIYAQFQDLNPKVRGKDDAGEVDARTKVRVRTTVSLCTQSNYINLAAGKKPLLELTLTGSTVNNTVTKPWQLTESAALDPSKVLAFCEAPQGILQ